MFLRSGTRNATKSEVRIRYNSIKMDSLNQLKYKLKNYNKFLYQKNRNESGIVKEKLVELKIGFVIFLVNLLSQGYILILTGTFWDDWLYYYHDIKRLWRHFIQSGRPSLVYIPAVFWNLPNYGYRWVVFLCYMVTSVIIYLLLRKITFFQKGLTRWECLIISCLYTVIPVNDARICMVDLPFTVSLLLFFLGFYFLVIYKNQKKKDVLKFRLLSLILFWGSFITNSMLVFYFLPLIYIFVCEWSSYGNFSKVVQRMFKNVDFILLPFIFWCGKQYLFPAYGIYSGYNEVSIAKLVNAIKFMPKAVYNSIKSTFLEFFSPFFDVSNVTILFILGGGFIVHLIYQKVYRKKHLKELYSGTKQDIIALGIGFLAVILGLFPYVVVSQSEYIRITGVEGRYSLLLPVGMSILIFYGIRILYKESKIYLGICTILLLFGIGACNSHYLDYQMDAYYQASLIEKLKENQFIKNEQNILFISNDNLASNSTRFYTLNGDASVAYGDQTRLIMNGYGDLHMLDVDLSDYQQMCYLMNDYDLNHHDLDGIIVYNCKIGRGQCLALKWLEVTDKVLFYDKVSSIAEFRYFPAKSNQALEMLERHE